LANFSDVEAPEVRRRRRAQREKRSFGFLVLASYLVGARRASVFDVVVFRVETKISFRAQVG
jgi:hypothetical protein